MSTQLLPGWLTQILDFGFKIILLTTSLQVMPSTKYISNWDVYMRRETLMQLLGIRLNLILKHFLFCTFLLLGGTAVAQEIPVPRCADVQDNGDVLVSWTPPNDPGNLFFSYLVFTLDAAGDPEQIGEIFDYNNTSFLHVGADAQFQQRTYFLRLRTGNVGQITSGDSPTIQTMVLNVQAGTTNSRAFLDWNPPFEVMLPSSVGIYDVFRENAPGEWANVGSSFFGEESHIDTILGICNDPPENINYRVRLQDNSGCFSTSSIDGDLLTDGIGPTPPVIETITYDLETGFMMVCWYPSPEEDTNGYIIQDNTDPSQYLTIGQVPGADSTSFLHVTQPTGPKRYLIIAFDECGNNESFGAAHESMYMNASFEECDLAVTLSWTPYIGWSNGVLVYEIYASENEGPYELVQSVAPNTLQATVEVNPFSDYCFLVKAVSAGPQKAAYANRRCVTTSYPELPDFTYLNRVDVIDRSTIEVNLLTDPDGFMMSYMLERRDLGQTDFVELGQMVPSPLDETIYRFIDEEVNTETRRYEYRAAATDFCGNFQGYSNVSSNILLNAFDDSEEEQNRIQWNSYEIWDGNVLQYRIFRSLGRDGAFEPLATVQSNITFYEDDVSAFIEDHGEFCYYIEAVENMNSFNRADTLRSNIACAVQEPLLWIPNAFVVGGYNDIFRPVAGYIDFDRYEMQIFSRWGKLMFQSNSIEIGWNGYHEGGIAPEGGYIYVITFRAGDGKTIEKKGSVILLNAFN